MSLIFLYLINDNTGSSNFLGSSLSWSLPDIPPTHDFWITKDFEEFVTELELIFSATWHTSVDWYWFYIFIIEKSCLFFAATKVILIHSLCELGCSWNSAKSIFYLRRRHHNNTQKLEGNKIWYGITFCIPILTVTFYAITCLV